MSWAKRIAGVFLGNAFSPKPQNRASSRPRTRRAVVEPLEDRRLLAVGFDVTPVDTGGLVWSNDPVHFGDALYFGASDPTHGVELWKMDASETVSLVADINPGSESSKAGRFAVLGEKLYFNANDGVHGYELWSMDSSETVSLVADIFSGAESSRPGELTVFDDAAYFRAQYAAPGFGLWKVDGSGNVELVRDYPDATRWSSAEFTVVDGFLYFRDPDSNLWKLDDSDNASALGELPTNDRIIGLEGSVFILDAAQRHEGFVRPSLWRLDASGDRTFLGNFGPDPESPYWALYSQGFSSQYPICVNSAIYIPVVESEDVPYGDRATLWSIDATGQAKQVYDLGYFQFGAEEVGMASLNEWLFFTDASHRLYATGSTEIVEPVRNSSGGHVWTALEYTMPNGDYLYARMGGGIYRLTYPEFDFGDAPESYATTTVVDGARHMPIGPRLGTARDAEADGLPTGTADGDDLAATDDEDGVTFASTIFVTAATVNVQNARDGAKLDAWIDFNGDGAFDGPGEKIANGLDMAEGGNLVSFAIPNGTVSGDTYARFRLSSAGGLSWNGSASDGEVEDYLVTIIPTDTSHYQHSETVDVGHGLLSDQGRYAQIDGDYSIVKGSDSVDIYHREGNDWLLMQQLPIGQRIGISGNRVVVGGSYSIDIYELREGVWQLQDTWELPGGGGDVRIASVAIDGDTIAVSAYDWEYEYFGVNPVGDVYLIEEVDGSWETVDTLGRTHVGVSFKNGTLGIAKYGFYTYESPMSTFGHLSPGYVAVYRRTEDGWRVRSFHAEVFDGGLGTLEDWDDGLGEGIVVDGDRAFGTAGSYILDVRWNESLGRWEEVGEIPRDGIVGIAIDGDIVAYGKTQGEGVSVYGPSGEKQIPIVGDTSGSGPYSLVAMDEGTLLHGVPALNEIRWYDLNLELETEEYLVPGKAGGEIVVSTSGEFAPLLELYDPSGQLVASSENGYLTYVASSAGMFSVKATSQTTEWVSYDLSILSELSQVDSVVDLGVVEDETVVDALAGSGITEYLIEASRDGYLTVLGHETVASGNLELTLLDEAGSLLAETAPVATNAPGAWPHEWRFDHPVTAGQTYRLWATGGGGQVDLRICNLVSPSGANVEVFGTDGSDTFDFAISETYDISVNGVEYSFDKAQTDLIQFGDAGGTDTLTTTGTDAFESARLHPGSVSYWVYGANMYVQADGVESITVNSGGGDDIVEMFDSDGDDTLTATPTQMVLTGTSLDGNTFTATANGFRYAHAYAKAGGNDTAEFVGSDQSERVKVYPTFVKLIGNDYYNRAKFFETATVQMFDGNDSGRVVAADGVDVLWAMNDECRVARNVQLAPGERPDFDNMAYDVTVFGCSWLVALADGGDDWVQLHDTALNDVLIAKPHKIEVMNAPRPADGVLRAAEYRITARRYQNVSAIADQGGTGDKAKLYDSGNPGVDVWTAAYVDGETWSTMTSPNRLLYEIAAFERIGGYGFNGGLGENHGTNRKDHAQDVDFVFQYGYWE